MPDEIWPCTGFNKCAMGSGVFGPGNTQIFVTILMARPLVSVCSSPITIVRMFSIIPHWRVQRPYIRLVLWDRGYSVTMFPLFFYYRLYLKMAIHFSSLPWVGITSTVSSGLFPCPGCRCHNHTLASLQHSVSY